MLNGAAMRSTKGSNARPYNPPADDMPTERKGGSIKAKKGTDMKKMASGGSFRSSANGIATKGKTKGKQVKMAGGGLANAAAMSGRAVGKPNAAAMSGRTFKKGGCA